MISASFDIDGPSRGITTTKLEDDADELAPQGFSSDFALQSTEFPTSTEVHKIAGATMSSFDLQMLTPITHGVLG